MIRLFYWLFRKPLLALYFKEQHGNKTGFEKSVRCHLDMNGLSYYTWPNKMDSPISRLQVIMAKETRFKFGLDSDGEDKLLEAMEIAINSGIKSQIAEIGFLLGELKRRKDIVRTPDMLFDLLATYYVRQDENPLIFDESIHKEKIEQFKLDSAGGLKAFFYTSGLMKSLNLPDCTENDFLELLLSSTVKQEALIQHLESYLSEQKL